jgi:hypothetical protein
LEPNWPESREIELLLAYKNLKFHYRNFEDKAERFAIFFRDAWLQIPEADRQVIMTYWKHCGNIPSVKLWSENEHNGKSPARVESGCQFFFDAERIFFCRQEWTRLSILEEMAHAFLWATEDPTHINQRTEKQTEEEWRDAQEKRVVEVLKQWNVDISAHTELVDRIKSPEWTLTPCIFLAHD